MNSVSGAFALNVLTHLPQVLCLLIIVAVQVAVAFFGYNLVHVFERYAFPILTVIFLIASGVILSKAHPGALSPHDSRRVPADVRRLVRLRGGLEPVRVGLHPVLQAGHEQGRHRPVVRARAVPVLRAARDRRRGGRHRGQRERRRLATRPAAFTGILATPLADLTLLAIALGAVSANVLNIYSGALSFTAIGIKLPLSLRRAIVALGFGTIGFFLAWSGAAQRGQPSTRTSC